MDICPELLYRKVVLRKRTSSDPASETGRNSGFSAAHVRDRRIQKTHNLLRAALSSLIAEKPYDAIVIKEILDRANVGRSTFYTHFRDKDDLLVSSIHGMVESVQSKSDRRSSIWYERILWFSLPIFEYHYSHRHNGRLTTGERGKAIQHGRLRDVLAEIIAAATLAEFSCWRKTGKSMSADLIVQYVVSTFVLVLDWWLESTNPLPPKEIDALFYALVLPTLASLKGERVVDHSVRR